jgi:hypothetical protein
MRTSHRTTARLAVTALAAGGVVVVGAAPASAAKSPPSCRLLVDPVGDVSPSYSAVVDVVSADVASGDTTVVGVLRVRDLRASDTATASGARWDLGFDVNGTRYTYGLRRDAQGFYTATFSRGPVVVAGPMKFVLGTDSITWTVPRSAVKDLPAKPHGDLLSGLGAETYASAADVAADRATSKATYTDGAPSCVPAA